MGKGEIFAGVEGLCSEERECRISFTVSVDEGPGRRQEAEGKHMSRNPPLYRAPGKLYLEMLRSGLVLFLKKW